VADPTLEPGRLAGDLAAELPNLDREEWRLRILAESPEAALAQAELSRAEAALARARAERVPDLEIEAGIRDNRERLASGDRAGREAFADVGIRLPLWNRNQGGIAAAEAEATRARLEAERVRLNLEGRYAAAYARYRQSAERARAYRERVLDRARQAYEMYKTQYSQMTAAYPQVLFAQHTLFQLEEDYARTLAQAWEAAVEIQNLLKK
jgi:cobalt-zinc-cadmium efflux system outer membrane protein